VDHHLFVSHLKGDTPLVSDLKADTPLVFHHKGDTPLVSVSPLRSETSGASPLR
jgi:hypothetical protein